MTKTDKLVLFGDSSFGEIAYEYFTHDSPYEVVAFTVTEAYLKRDSLFGVPVVPFERVHELYPPDQHAMHVALVYNNLNRTRRQFYREAKAKGYRLANYVSSKGFIWRNVTMGDNVFIFEDNTVQPFVKLGSNLVLWSGNHIGHHSEIKDHCFISSHVVVSGHCTVGECCFIGVNATIGNNVNVGNDCLLGAGVLITKDTGDGKLFRGPVTAADERDIYTKLGIQPDSTDR